MILVTCTISSFVVTRAARNIAEQEKENESTEDASEKNTNRFLLPVSDEETVQHVVELSALLHRTPST